MKSPQPPSMIWHSIDSIQLPPAAPSGPTQWSRMPESRVFSLRGPQVSLAPLPLGDQVIVAEVSPVVNPAELLARDPDHAVAHREDLLGVVVSVVLGVGVEAGQVLAVELEDRLSRLGSSGSRGRTTGYRLAPGRRLRRRRRSPGQDQGDPERGSRGACGRLVLVDGDGAAIAAQRRWRWISAPCSRQIDSTWPAIFSSGQAIESIMPWPASICSGGVTPSRSLGTPSAVRSWIDQVALGRVVEEGDHPQGGSRRCSPGPAGSAEFP